MSADATGHRISTETPSRMLPRDEQSANRLVVANLWVAVVAFGLAWLAAAGQLAAIAGAATCRIRARRNDRRAARSGRRFGGSRSRSAGAAANLSSSAARYTDRCAAASESPAPC